jgi:hypothetical protein
MTELQVTRLRRAFKIIALLMVKPMTVRDMAASLNVDRPDNLIRLLDMAVEEGLVYVESFRKATGGKGADAAVYAMQPRPNLYTSATRSGKVAQAAHSAPRAPIGPQAETFEALRMLGRAAK